MTRYRCVAARKAEGFAVICACGAAGVSRWAFYDWLDRPAGPTEAEIDEAYLIDEIVDIHRSSGGTYGQPRITPELARRGWVANHKRVERLMADNRRLHSTLQYRPPIEWELAHQASPSVGSITAAAKSRCPARGGKLSCDTVTGTGRVAPRMAWVVPLVVGHATGR